MVAFVALVGLCAQLCAEELSMEPRENYVYAKDRIPGFEKNRNLAEGYVLDPIPDGWKAISLDGDWKLLQDRSGDCVDYYAIDEKFGPRNVSEFLAPGYDFGAWKTINVPLPLCRQKIDGKVEDAWMKPGYIAFYQRVVDVPDFKTDAQSVFLKFFGAGFRTDVWIDGKYVGGHAGYFNPFDFDITSFVKSGQKADLLVKTIHTRHKMLWHDPLVTGIFAPVRLEVRGNLYAKNIRLSVNRDQKSVEVQYDVFDTNKVGKASLEALIEEAKGGKVVGKLSQQVSFGGKNSFTVSLDNPHEWSPDDPFLYNLKIKFDGKEAGIVRFGYRTIEVKDGADGRKHFYLNGKRFYMLAFEYDYFWAFMKQQKLAPVPDDAYCMNYQGQMRESLLAMKFANVNTFRPHSMELSIDQTFLNLCDELGFLVYLDWHGSETTPMVPVQERPGMHMDSRITTLEKTLPSFSEMLVSFHNHPSLSFISYGNELYDHLLDNGSFDQIIEKYYAAHKAVDLQNRPASGSTGRPTYKHKAKVDFVDDHQYIGVYYGSYKSVLPYLKETPGMIKLRFGSSLPFVNMETGYVSDDRIHQKTFDTLGAELRKENFDKNLYIKIITGKSAEEAWARLALNAGGVRPYYTDLPAFKNRKAYLHVKHWIEMFRMNHDITDGVSLNTGFASVGCKNDPDFHDNLAQPWPKSGELAIMEPIYAYRNAFNPMQAFLDIDNLHPLCGDSTPAPITLVNDSEKDAVVDLSIMLRTAKGQTSELLVKKGLAIPQGGNLSIPFTIVIPEGAESGKHVIEIYLCSNGAKIAENFYDIYTLAKKDRKASFPAKKLALYDTAASTFAGLGVKTTKEIVDTLKIKYELIKDFNSLDNYQALVIGANSMDGTLLDSGEKIFNWLSAGGRLVMFEQCVSAAIPWSSDERIYNMGKSSIVEHYFKKHDIFNGVEDEMAWESPWGHNAAVYETCLDLNDSFLTVTAPPHFQEPGCPNAVITDRRVGKGEYLLSMVTTTDRFNKDATITAYVENLMAYLLNDSISPYAVAAKDATFSKKRSIILAKEDAVFVDLRKAVNQGFADEVAGDGKGGWTDFGRDADMRNMPVGSGNLSGMVPFEVIDPAKNDGKSCVVLAGPKRETFPKESPSIPVGGKFEKLFFLQTSMYVKAEKGESILDYEITYDDGQKIVVPMRNKVEISDWWMAQDYENSAVVHRDGDKCVFAAEWVNPQPTKKIASLKAVSKGNAIPVILGITGKKKFDQARDRDEGGGDNRK